MELLDPFFFLYYTKSVNLNIFIVAIITSLACQFGDLLFSYIKRSAKVKDTGNFFPGHGGILDRIDGILLGLPIGFLSLVFIKLKKLFQFLDQLGQ